MRNWPKERALLSVKLTVWGVPASQFSPPAGLVKLIVGSAVTVKALLLADSCQVLTVGSDRQ